MAGIGSGDGVTLVELRAISEYSNSPAKPWLPRASNLPFQFWSGNHTSKLIGSAAPGSAMPPVTRQKAGSWGEVMLDEQVGAMPVVPSAA